MAIIPYRPGRGYGASLFGDAQVEDQELQDADLTMPGVVTRGPGARELAARVHETGGTETPLSAEGAQALFYRPDVAGDELCMVHNDTLYTSKPTEVTANGTQAWREVGTWAPWTLRNTALIYPQTQVRDWDVAPIVDAATGKRYFVAVWEQANLAGDIGQPAAPGVYAAAFDETGGLVAPVTTLAAGATIVNPRVCACDTGVVILWHDTATAMWVASAWRLSNPIEFATPANVVAGTAGTAPLHDLRKDGANDRVIAVFSDSVAPFNVSIRRITVSLVVTSLGGFAVVQAPSVGISVDVDPLGGYLISWADATTANAVHVTSAGAVDTVIATVATALPPVRITGCHVDGVASQGTVVVEQRTGFVPDYQSHCQTFSYDGLALANVRTQRGCFLAGHAQVFAGRPLFVGVHTSGESSAGTVFASDALTGDVLSRAFPLSAMGSPTYGELYTQPCTPHAQGARATWGLKRTFPTGTGPGVFTDSAGIFTMEIERDMGPRKPATAPGYVFDAMSGLPMVYDGFEASEGDWNTSPMIATAVAAGGGSLTASSTYVVATTYRWLDRRGQVWRSAPFALAVPLGVGQTQITVSIVTARWSTRRSNVAIELWRSLANQGSPLYLEQTVGIAPNDPSVDLVVLIANASDAASATQPQLDQFAPTNILPHESVAVTDFMAFALGRLWAPDPERPDIIRHTIAHEIDRDGFGWGWEDNQIVQLDTSVRAQAMGPLDGPALAVLAGDVCHVVYGLGPDKQGTGLFGQVDKFAVVDLETSQPLTASVPDSAVPGGLAYATPRGLFLLRRDRVSQPLSLQVDRLFRVDGLSPQALAYLPTQGELMLTTLTEEQRALRLSLTTGRWCADSARQAQDVASSPRGEVAWLLADGRVRILDASLIADGDDDLAFRMTTPTLRIDPGNVAQPVNVQGIFLHTYLVAGPALLNVSVVDARAGGTVTLDPQTFSVVGPESRSTEQVSLPTFGHRVTISQPPGNAGKIVIVEIDSQVAPADAVVARTVNAL